MLSEFFKEYKNVTLGGNGIKPVAAIQWLHAAFNFIFISFEAETCLLSLVDNTAVL